MNRWYWFSKRLDRSTFSNLRMMVDRSSSETRPVKPVLNKDIVVWREGESSLHAGRRGGGGVRWCTRVRACERACGMSRRRGHLPRSRPGIKVDWPHCVTPWLLQAMTTPLLSTTASSLQYIMLVASSISGLTQRANTATSSTGVSSFLLLWVCFSFFARVYVHSFSFL